MKDNKYIKLFKYYKRRFIKLPKLYDWYKTPSFQKLKVYNALVEKYSKFCDTFDYGIISANSFIFVFVAFDITNNKLYVETPTKSLVFKEVY